MEEELNYRIVWSDDAFEVATEVSNLIKEGWRPLGGVALSAMLKLEHGHHWIETIFAQAVVREIITYPMTDIMRARARAEDVLTK